MTIALVCAYALFLASFSYNISQSLKLKRVKARPQSVELREFIADISGGAGFLAMSRLSPDDFVMRSPRQHR